LPNAAPLPTQDQPCLDGWETETPDFWSERYLLLSLLSPSLSTYRGKLDWNAWVLVPLPEEDCNGQRLGSVEEGGKRVVAELEIALEYVLESEGSEFSQMNHGSKSSGRGAGSGH